MKMLCSVTPLFTARCLEGIYFRRKKRLRREADGLQHSRGGGVLAVLLGFLYSFQDVSSYRADKELGVQLDEGAVGARWRLYSKEERYSR